MLNLVQLKDVSVEFRRPGYGIGPDHYEALLEQKFAVSVHAGHMLRFSDLNSGKT